jgi:hypothetical protein
MVRIVATTFFLGQNEKAQSKNTILSHKPKPIKYIHKDDRVWSFKVWRKQCFQRIKKTK